MARFLSLHDNDTQALPARGRTFPLSIESVRTLVVAAAIRRPDGRRVSVIFRNPRVSETREAIVAEFRPGSELTFLSVPNRGEAEATVLWSLIVEHAETLGRRKVPDRPGYGPIYRFRGGLDGLPLSVVERWYHFQTHKYRGTDKFSSGVKRKLLKIDEYAVPLRDQLKPVKRRV